MATDTATGSAGNTASYRWAWIAAAVVAVSTGVAGGAAVWHWMHILTNVGFAHSFDTMLYARGLWGLGHGEPFNPIAGTHTLAIHGHFGLWLLAPLTTSFRAVDVLDAVQGASLGAALTVSTAAAAARVRALVTPPAMVAWTIFFAICLLATPLTLNPFLFGSRPDCMGIPLLLAGAMLTHWRGLWHPLPLTLLAAGVAMREEYAMTVIGLALVCPVWSQTRPVCGSVAASPPADDLADLDARAQLAGRQFRDWRSRLPEWWRRVAVVLVCLLWWALYWLVVREWLGGPWAAERVAGAADTLLGGPRWLRDFGRAWTFKLEILCVCLGYAGVAQLSGRRLVAMLPGLLFLLVMNRMAECVLTFHYSFFVLPACVWCAVEGLVRLVQLRRRWRVVIASLALVVSVGTGWWSASAPWGKRYEPVFWQADSEYRVHASDALPVLACLPPEAAVVVPYEHGASVADRAWLARTDLWVRGRAVEHDWQWVVLMTGPQLRTAIENDRLAGLDRVSQFGRLVVYAAGEAVDREVRACLRALNP